MEKQQNTAIIDLKYYNELRDFKINIEENYTYRLSSSYFGGESVSYITIDKTIEEINKKTENLKRKLDTVKDNVERECNIKLRKKDSIIESLEKDLASSRAINKKLGNDLSLLDFNKNMNFFQFLKWKKNNKNKFQIL